MENESESDEEEDTKKKTRTLSKRKELRKIENDKTAHQSPLGEVEHSEAQTSEITTQDFQRALLVAETLSCVRDEPAQPRVPDHFQFKLRLNSALLIQARAHPADSTRYSLPLEYLP